VVFLKHFAELTFREIGRVTGVPMFTAAARYRLALRRLRQHLRVEP
jgi:DNA-directed RNA polymerase specialized sigma24 family protein